MYVRSAQVPLPEDGADRVLTCPNALVVLDGATAFVPVPVSAGEYADVLGRRLLEQLTQHPAADLRDSLREAIRGTAAELDLQPGKAPSSTVSIVRESARAVDVLVLGDSPVIVAAGEGTAKLSDDRLEDLGLPEQREYRSRLASGTGYDDQHKSTLRALQQHQAQYRNRHGGYWIAEADPDAADHALCWQFERESVRWAVVATDGAADSMAHLALDDWPAIAELRTERLRERLLQCQEWEEHADPGGALRPRAKRHDDKSLAVARFDSAAPWFGDHLGTKAECGAIQTSGPHTTHARH